MTESREDRERAALQAAAEGETRRLAPNASRLVVAVSGGGDSVAALHLLQRAGFDLVAAHFDHRLRTESGADARFVQELCARLGVPLEGSSADVAAVAQRKGWNVEDAARRLRYAFLYRVLKEAAPGGAIVVAHTLEDQAETVLLQLLRGVAYPVGIRPRQRGVIRPLLGERRAALRRYLEHLGESWREDATNLTLEQNRAWLRNRIIPELEARYPQAQLRLAETAHIQQEARAALTFLAHRRFPPGPIRLAAWQRAPVALRKAALVERLEQVGATPSDRLLTELDAAAMRGAAQGFGAAPWRTSLPGGGRVELAYGQLHVEPPAAEDTATETAPVQVTSPEQLPREVNADVLERYPRLELRRRRSGDRIRLPGGRRLLSDVLIDLKVPRGERDALRVLAAGHEVLWVEGVAVAVDAAAEGVPALLDADRRHMRTALEQAKLAHRLGEVPVGAVVVSAAGEVLAAAHNLTETRSDPTAHAETLALRQAAQATGDWRLAGATLYVTLEPCPMCLGAVLQTQLARLVYGASNPRDGALGGVTDLAGEGWKRVPAIKGGVEARAAEQLLKAAFARRRSGQAEAPLDDGEPR